MSIATIIVIVVAFVIVAAAATVAGTLTLRWLAVRSRFGPEYQRLAGDVGPRRAQAELAERRRHVAQLGIRPLTKQQRARYASEWDAAQERFVDGPARAAEAAAALIAEVARERGYSADGGKLPAELSVHHARALDRYRRAREVTDQAGTRSTEELRQAFVGYRVMFRELLGPADQAAADTAGEDAGAADSAAAEGAAAATKDVVDVAKE